MKHFCFNVSHYYRYVWFNIKFHKFALINGDIFKNCQKCLLSLTKLKMQTRKNGQDFLYSVIKWIERKKASYLCLLFPWARPPRSWTCWCSSWGACPRWPRWCSSGPVAAFCPAVGISSVGGAALVSGLSRGSGTWSK